MHIAPHLPALTKELQAVAQAESIDVCIVGAIVEKEGTILIVTRAHDEDLFPDHAEIPGGTVDPGETLLEATVRELKEETGLDIEEIVDYRKGFDYTSSSGKKVRQFNFIVRTSNHDIVLNPKEHSAFAWIAPSDTESLNKLQITPEMREIVENIICHC